MFSVALLPPLLGFRAQDEYCDGGVTVEEDACDCVAKWESGGRASALDCAGVDVKKP